MSCSIAYDFGAWWGSNVTASVPTHWGIDAATTFAVVAAAEVGDKSQLVCMTLAARHRRGVPVVWGAATAFALLNLAAVTLGTAARHWLPEIWVLSLITLLFAIFGVLELRRAITPDTHQTAAQQTDRGLFWTTLWLIFFAEFGDKTQIAVAGLSASASAGAVWLGATVALTATSAMGIWTGRQIMRWFAPHWLHRVGGLLFLGLAGATAVRLTQTEPLRSWLQLLWD